MHRNLESSELGDRLELELEGEGEGTVRHDKATSRERVNNATDTVCVECVASKKEHV